MRLSRLTLERYGPFEHLDLALDPAPGRLNLLVAPNGFGKSVIRRGIGDLLFGIPERTPMDFRFGTERMRLVAGVVQGGAEQIVVRRKGRGNTLASADGTPIPPELVPRLFGTADERLFRDLFGLDTALLRSGGQELMRSQGRLGQVLFAAGGGMARVRELLTRLERQRDDFGLAGQRHKSRPLWRAFSDLEEARRDLSKAALRPDLWARLEREADEAARACRDLQAEQDALASERDLLRLNGAARPWLVRLHKAQLAVEETQDAPVVEAGLEARWREALGEAAQSAIRLQVMETDLAAAREARAALSFDQAWLDAAETIDALAEMRGRSQGALADLPKVVAELEEYQSRCSSLRRDLGLAEGVALPPAPAARDALIRLRERPQLAADAEAAEQLQDEAEAELARQKQVLAGLADAGDSSAIASLADMLRGEGHPGARCRSADEKQRAARSALRAALAAIPDRPLPEAALQATAAASEPALDFAGRALSQAESACQQSARAAEALQKDIDDSGEKLALLVRRAMLPAPDALTASRQDREAQWRRFCAAPASATPDAIVLLDRAIRDADSLADALIAHAQEAADAAALRGHLAELAQKHAEALARGREDADGLAKARQAFAGLARACGSNAPDVASLRVFLRARGDAVSRLLESQAVDREAAAMRAGLEAQGERLAAALGVEAPAVEALGTLLDEADRRIADSRTAAAQRAALLRQIETQTATLAGRTKAAQQARARLERWEQAWAGVAPLLARPPGEALTATEAALALVEDLRGAEMARDKDALRVADMRAEIARLAAQVEALAPLAPDLPDLAPIEAAQQFERRLRAERQHAARCRDADERIGKMEAALGNARDKAAEARQALAGLRAALRADTDDAAEQQLQRARTARDARQSRDEALRELARQGGGLSVEALAERCGLSSEDADSARVAAIASRLRELAGLIETAQEARHQAAKRREEAEASLGAADAAARREAAQAELARLTEEALVLHAAQALLRAALDRQAAGADQPLLNRIGAIFAAITGGAYAGVAIEDTKAGPIMLAVEADGSARKPLEHLSEGTGDQLYLALRMAALESFAQEASPLPFIVDDILQTFDDPRTEATLRALLDLSAHVQVIALTHHHHVGALAQDMAVHIIRPSVTGMN